MKGLLVLLLVLVLAGCGDFQWFPEDGTTATTAPPTTPTQQTFNNTSTASGPTMPALPVDNAADKVSVTIFRFYENSRDTANVSLGFDVEVENTNSTEAKVQVTIAAKNASQADIPVTTTTATVAAGGRTKWYPTASLPIASYESIRAWTLAVAKIP